MESKVSGVRAVLDTGIAVATRRTRDEDIRETDVLRKCIARTSPRGEEERVRARLVIHPSVYYVVAFQKGLPSVSLPTCRRSLGELFFYLTLVLPFLLRKNLSNLLR